MSPNGPGLDGGTDGRIDRDPGFSLHRVARNLGSKPDVQTAVPGMAGLVGTMCEARAFIKKTQLLKSLQLKTSLQLLLFYGVACAATSPDDFKKEWPRVFRVPTSEVVATTVVVYLVTTTSASKLTLAPGRYPEGNLHKKHHLLVCVTSALVSAIGSLLFLGLNLRIGSSSSGAAGSAGHDTIGSQLSWWLSTGYPPLTYGQVIAATWLEGAVSVVLGVFSLVLTEKNASVTSGFLFVIAIACVFVNFIALFWPYNNGNTTSTLGMHGLTLGQVSVVWAFSVTWFCVVGACVTVVRNAARKTGLGNPGNFIPGVSTLIAHTPPQRSSASNNKYVSTTLTTAELNRVRADVLDARFGDGERTPAEERESREGRKSEKKLNKESRQAVDVESGDGVFTAEEMDGTSAEQRELTAFRVVGIPLTSTTLSLLARDCGGESADLSTRNDQTDFLRRWVATQAHAEQPGFAFGREYESADTAVRYDSNRHAGYFPNPGEFIHSEEPDPVAAEAEASVPKQHKLRVRQKYLEATYPCRADIQNANDWVDSCQRIYAGLVENPRDSSGNRTNAEPLCVSILNVPRKRVDRSFTLTVSARDLDDGVETDARNDASGNDSPGNAGDSRNADSSAKLEAFLHACVGDDCVRLETMLSHPRIRRYLRSVRSIDGTVYNFPMKTAHITL